MFSFRTFSFRTKVGCTIVLLCSLSCPLVAIADTVNSLGHDLKPALGKPASVSNKIASFYGTGLPRGSGSVAAGKILYDSRCAACHGIDGQQPGNQLVGGVSSLATNSPLKTVGSYWPYAMTLFDYIGRAMPYNEQKTLSANDTYAVTAYVLKLNGILDDDAALNEKNLSKVKMPNRAGFIELIQ